MPLLEPGATAHLARSATPFTGVSGLRILAISNLYPPDVMGGYEIACAQAVDALRARGHEVHVLSGTPRRPLPEAKGVDRCLKLTEDRHWVTQSGSREDALLLQRDIESRLISAHNVHKLIETSRNFRPDVVYLCNVVGLGGLGLLACLQHLGIPWVWQLGDRIPLDLCSAGGRLIPELAEFVEQWLVGHSIAVSRQLFEAIERIGVKLSGPVEIIPYWVTGLGAFQWPRKPSGSGLRILSCGRVHAQKGADILIKAAALVKARGHARFCVDFFGELTDPTIPPLIRALGVDDVVSLRGACPHEELQRKYHEYDLLAFPTRESEPFGIVPLEALAQGCVPVISRCCGVAEWLVDGVHCLKADRDASAFAGVFSRVIDGSIDLEPISRRGHALVARDFHVDEVIDRVERVLHDSTRSPRSRAGSVEDAYRLARLAEGLARSFVQDAICA